MWCFFFIVFYIVSITFYLGCFQCDDAFGVSCSDWSLFICEEVHFFCLIDVIPVLLQLDFSPRCLK